MMKRTLLTLLVLLPLAGVAAPEDELLDGDQAFAMSTRVVDADTLEASWKIAPGYYLYRDKFKFEPVDTSFELKPARFPRGKIKDDPSFGKVETYIGSVKVRLPIARRAPEAATLRLRITSQGCNEPVGVCYPPIVKEVVFAVPAKAGAGAAVRAPAPSAALATAITTPPPSTSPFGKITPASPSTGAATVAPDPDQAFRAGVLADGATLLARIDINECCYLYRDKTRFELVNAPVDVRLGAFTLPPGQVKMDPFIGRTEIYHQGVDVRLPVESAEKPFNATLKITYQGCSEKGVTICFPPTTRSFQISMNDGVLAALPMEDGTAGGRPVVPRDFRELLLAVLGAFAAGLLLTFTPCVLPMIPIVSGALVRTGDATLSKLHGGLLSYTYVFGTAVTYTVAGAVAGATGEQLQAYFQNPLAVGTFAAILALLALSMFGLYELQMPSFIQSKLHYHTHKIRGSSFVGAFLLGIVSALVVGACVSPVLISVLGAAIAAQDPVLGGAIMFALAHGQGVVLVALGVGAGFLLPRAGMWMNKVKYVFGVMLLGVSIYLLGFIPQVPVLFLWAALFIITGVYLGATESLPHGSTGWRYLWKGLGTVLLIWGVLALLGGMAGNRDILNPVTLTGTTVAAAPAAPAATEEKLFERVATVAALEKRLAEARAAGRPAILDYYADWCTDCVRMEKTTFRDARVHDALRRFVRLQVDVTEAGNPDGIAIKKRFGVFGPPAMLFFGADGSEKKGLRTYGYRKTEDFLAIAGKI